MAGVASPSLLTDAALTKPAEALDYWRLLKPRVMALVTFTGAIGLYAAPGAMHPLLAVLAIVAIALGGGAAGAFNMAYEAERDALMERTKNRPVPAGRIPKEDAFAFALAAGFFALLLMDLAAGVVAAGWLLVSMLLYTVVYTVWLKPRTWQNIVWGGASGALPPVIGWAAATGSAAAFEPWLLTLIIFFWTPPHFWALSLYKNDDYRKAGIPMLPVVKGLPATRKQIIYYCIPLIGCSLALPALGYSGVLFLTAAILFGVLLLRQANRVFLDKTDAAARRLFGLSIVYLFALFLAYAADKVLFWPVSLG